MSLKDKLIKIYTCIETIVTLTTFITIVKMLYVEVAKIISENFDLGRFCLLICCIGIQSITYLYCVLICEKKIFSKYYKLSEEARRTNRDIQGHNIMGANGAVMRSEVN